MRLSLVPSTRGTIAVVNRSFACRSLRSKKESHMNAAHPYSPFPVERLEAAVAAVPEEAFAADEAALNRFAQPYLFKW